MLIADDEPIIREGIREAVDWHALGMTVTAEAEDGEEALELASAHAAHVLLVDLNMPIMNGITLIRSVRKQLPACRIVIITGHDEFSYAQEALRLNVDDYILKPVNPGQLKKVLQSVRDKLEREAEQEKYLSLAYGQIAKNLPLLRERFGLDWIAGSMETGEIRERLQFLQLPPDPPKQIGIIRCPELAANQPLLKESDRQLYLFAVENIAAEWLKSRDLLMFRDGQGSIVVCLWQDARDTIAHDIERSVKDYLKITANLAFVPVTGGLTDVAAAYITCRKLVLKEAQITPLVRRARQFIRERYADPELTLETLAQSLQVSPVYLSRIMKQELGTSFVNLITQTRVNNAIKLLNSTDLPIHEIAGRVGYESQHYFSTAFKKTVGVSPNQYRRGAAFPKA